MTVIKRIRWNPAMDKPPSQLKIKDGKLMSLDGDEELRFEVGDSYVNIINREDYIRLCELKHFMSS